MNDEQMSAKGMRILADPNVKLDLPKAHEPIGLKEFDRQAIEQMRLLIGNWAELQNNINRMSPKVRDVFNGLLRSVMDSPTEHNRMTLADALDELLE